MRINFDNVIVNRYRDKYCDLQESKSYLFFFIILVTFNNLYGQTKIKMIQLGDTLAEHCAQMCRGTLECVLLNKHSFPSRFALVVETHAFIISD